MIVNWMEALVRTYDACIGDLETRNEPVPLVPICHTLNNMHITVTVDGDGGFVSAEVVPKEEQNTIIPCTEESAGRTSAPSPHPLDDKLTYLMAGISNHLQDKKSERFDSAHKLYVDLLTDWCNSEFSNEKTKTVLEYIRKGTLFDDLVRSGVLIAEGGIISSKAEAPTAPLFEIGKLSSEQSEAFVRWAVSIPGDPVIDTWEDETVINSWISFVLSRQKSEGLCYLSGKEVPLATNHPSKIRNSGDMAKIISANDKDGFTFRGRFENSEQACGIGFEESQKMHSALRWLIGRQGYRQGDFALVSWTIEGDNVRSPVDDMYDILDFDSNKALTNKIAAEHLNQRIRGYNSKILTKDVLIMAMDSAQSGKGRLAVTMFRRSLGEDMVKSLEKWHEGCAWLHRYAKVKGDDGELKSIAFIGAPSPRDIAWAAYGPNADDKIVSNAVKRIIPCILDGETVPSDIVNSVVIRASNPISMETWAWEKTLSIACSVFKRNSKEVYDMVLEKDRKSRDYLYGRLLAIADLMEAEALKKADERRQTTAIRLMQKFSEFPYTTWTNIELALVPYAARLGGKAQYYQQKIAEIMDLFEGDDFRNNSKLSGEFLLAYHCQREDHFRKKTENVEEEMEE